MGEGRSGIAIIGDLHSAWDDADVAYFNRSPYQLLLFTGDLGASTREDGARIATSISRIDRDVLVMPGNNDAAQHGALAAELAYRHLPIRQLRGLGSGARAPAVKLCGYSSHSYALPAGELTVIAGRPFSMGGPEITFKAELEASFGISSLEQSATRIAELAAAAPTRDLILLSHNGPAGLGANADSIWGRDFAAPSADWGDRDLTRALEQIHARGARRVLAVVAGHMHSPIRGGGEREIELHRGGVLYLNPARVPRIFEREDGHEVRHHVELTMLDGALHAQHHLVSLDEA